MNKEQKLKLVWKHTHRDFKGTYEGLKTIMVLRQGGSQLVALNNITDEEINDRLPKEFKNKS